MYMKFINKTELDKSTWETKPRGKRKRRILKETRNNVWARFCEKKEKAWGEARKTAQERKEWNKCIKNSLGVEIMRK